MSTRANDRVTIDVDRDTAEWLAATGGDALKLLVQVGMFSSGGSREHAEKLVRGIEGWRRVREAVRAAGVEFKDND